MYKLILVSDRKEVRDLYESFAGWMDLGFEKPSIAENTAQAAELMGKKRFDAVTTLLSVGESQTFFRFLAKKPEMMGVEAASSAERLHREISTARRALSSRDAARQNKQLDDFTHSLQYDFFYDLLRGTGMDERRVDERMKSLEFSTVEASRPIVTTSFRIPQGEYFMNEVWHYGRERLEKAFRNIFERDEDNPDNSMYYQLLVMNAHHMRLIGFPCCDLSESEVYARTVAHMESCREALKEFFDIDMEIKRYSRYESVYALAKENILRTAH